MTDTRPFEPALFHETAIDPETASLNAQIIELFTGQPEWWIVGAQAARAGTSTGRRSVPRTRVLGPGAYRDHHRQGRQRDPFARHQRPAGRSTVVLSGTHKSDQAAATNSP